MVGCGVKLRDLDSLLLGLPVELSTHSDELADQCANRLTMQAGPRGLLLRQGLHAVEWHPRRE